MQNRSLSSSFHSLNSPKFLITGNPGIGKTPLMLKLADYYERICPVNGFYTREIQQSGRRIGFGIKTFGGFEKILAHVDWVSRYRVGRYGVSISNLEEVLQTIQSFPKPPDIWMIDEIGKMESFSQRFRIFIEKIFDENTTVIATIAKSAGGWISKIRQRNDIMLLELDYTNRENFFQNFITEHLLKFTNKTVKS